MVSAVTQKPWIFLQKIISCHMYSFFFPNIGVSWQEKDHLTESLTWCLRDDRIHALGSWLCPHGPCCLTSMGIRDGGHRIDYLGFLRETELRGVGKELEIYPKELVHMVLDVGWAEAIFIALAKHVVNLLAHKCLLNKCWNVYWGLLSY